MSAPALSVVIPTLGRPTLRATLDSLLRANGSEDIEIIVAGDWTSGPDTAELDRLMAEHPRIRHLRVRFARGSAHAASTRRAQRGNADASTVDVTRRRPAPPARHRAPCAAHR